MNIVTGPGNIYVTEAKRLLRGQVGIDSEAGPTEIAVVADDSADPAYVAADLISQAEHDVVAASVLITDSEALADAVDRELALQVAAAKHSERIREALTGRQSAVVLTRDLAQSLECADAYAAEHLEIHTRNAAQDAAAIRNAGAIFVGPYSPVSLGDYLAGSNHVLPTAGCACHSSGLNVTTFLRSVQVVEYDRAALAGLTDELEALALAEDLPSHAWAVTVRRDHGAARERSAPAPRTRRAHCLRCAATRGPHRAEHQREPLPASAGDDRAHRCADRPVPEPVPGPRRRGAARGAGRVPQRARPG